MRRLIVLLAAFPFALAGCATIASSNKDKARDMTLENYAATLRFGGGFPAAWQFVDPKMRAAHPLDGKAKARYDSVEVASYQTDGPVATDDNTIQQIAQITLVVRSSQTSYDIVDHEIWHWDETGKHWWLESGLPDITPPQ